MNIEKLLNIYVSLFIWFTTDFLDTGLTAPSFIKSTEIQNKFCSTAATVNLGYSRSLLECSGRCFNLVLCQSLFYKQSGICVGCTSVFNDSFGCSVEIGTRYYLATAVMTSSSTTTSNTMVTTPMPMSPQTTVPPPTTEVTDLPTTTNFPPTNIPLQNFIPMTPCMPPFQECPHEYLTCVNMLCVCAPGYSVYSDMITFSCVDGCTEYGITHIEYTNRFLDDPNGKVYEEVLDIQCQEICWDTSECRGWNYNIKEMRCMIVFETPLTIPNDYIPHTEYDYYNRNCGGF